MSEAMNYDFDQAKEFMTRLEAEVAANVHLTEEHRALLIGAVSLGSAILLEGVPGTGKTHTAKTIAAAMGGDFQRIQGTPDTLPADIRGTRIYNPSLEGNFEFEEGPVFANVLLLDELNRIPPKSQAALLDVMGEHQVTVGRKTYKLKEPFLVMGSKNPYEIAEGTYRIPVAAQDRFPFSIDMPELTESDLVSVEQMQGNTVSQVVKAEELPVVSEIIDKVVTVPPEMSQRSARLVVKMRTAPHVDRQNSVLGGARPHLAIIRHSKALAMQEGKRTVHKEHIDRVAPFILRHRIELDESAFEDNMPVEDVIRPVIVAA